MPYNFLSRIVGKRQFDLEAYFIISAGAKLTGNIYWADLYIGINLRFNIAFQTIDLGDIPTELLYLSRENLECDWWIIFEFWNASEIVAVKHARTTIASCHIITKLCLIEIQKRLINPVSPSTFSGWQATKFIGIFYLLSCTMAATAFIRSPLHLNKL